MKNFKMNRFAHVLSYTFATSRRHLLSGVVGMLVCFLLMFVVANYNHWSQLPQTLLIVDQACGTSLLAAFIFFMVSAGTLFRPEQSKQGRAALLMLPASNLEKFLARWVYLWVFTIAGLLMFFVADGLHYAFHYMLGHEPSAALNYMLSAFNYDYPDNWTQHDIMMRRWGLTAWWLAFMALHAYFILGSTLLRRHSFIFAAVVYFFILVTWVWFMANVANRLVREDHEVRALFVASIVAIILFIWLAYRCFCRWQLITRQYLSI